MKKCLHKSWVSGQGKLSEVLLMGSAWNSISSCIESAEELKKYLNVLQRKKACNSRNSLSLATTISKGNPGTASLWRRILEIFSEPGSNKEQKWVFVTSISSLLAASDPASEWGSLLSSACFPQWFSNTLWAPHTVQKSYFYKNPWGCVRSPDVRPPSLLLSLREENSGRKPIICSNINTHCFSVLLSFKI